MLTRYEAGKLAVTNGSDIVIGYCTSWLTYVTPGSVLVVNGTNATIAAILEVGWIRLTEQWSGETTDPTTYHIDICQP